MCGVRAWQTCFPESRPFTAGYEHPNRIDQLRDVEGSNIVGNEILPLLCPEWRPPTMVLEATDASMMFANSQCIELLRRQSPIRLVRGCVTFSAPHLTRRFHLHLAHLLASGEESTFLFERDFATGDWLSVTIRNGQGFFRHAIRAGLGISDRGGLMVVELSAIGQGLDPTGFAALAKAASLTRAEAQLVNVIVTGSSLREAAISQGIAISTVRQRVKSILFKTGCRSQVQLVRLVLTMCPRV